MTKNTENNDGLLARKIEYISGFMLPERAEVLRATLARRTRYITVCMENTFHPQNASALVRNCEAFGIQDIHTVEALCKFSPNVNIVRGTDKWVDIHKTGSTGGDPAVHAVDAAPGVVRRLADSGRRAGRNPAALDENDRPGRRTDHETGRFLSSLKTNKARLRERFPRPYFLLFPDIMLRELRSTRHAPSPSHEFRNGPFR